MFVSEFLQGCCGTKVASRFMQVFVVFGVRFCHDGGYDSPVNLGDLDPFCGERWIFGSPSFKNTCFQPLPSETSVNDFDELLFFIGSQASKTDIFREDGKLVEAVEGSGHSKPARVELVAPANPLADF